MTQAPLTVLRGSELSIDPLRSRVVAMLGFGNQGCAQAECLRDSGLNVIVGARSTAAATGGHRARESGFEVHDLPDAAARSDLVVMALPDEVHPAVMTSIAPALRPDTVVGFMHGYSWHFGDMPVPETCGIVMVAPKGPGRTLRDRFTRGQGIPCLFAVERENGAQTAESIALAWAAGIGCGRAAAVRTTFAHEAETDLFGEQAVLCGGMTALMLAAFETLVEAGYPRELAYMECVQEAKQVADLVYEGGLAAMMERISNTAEFGAYAAVERMNEPELKARMRERLEAIRSGAFAQRMAADHRDGFPWRDTWRQHMAAHAAEQAGDAVRGWMPWLDGG